MSRMLVLVVLCAALLARAAAVTKVWTWSNDWAEPRHWEEGRVPCPGQAAILPQEVVFMPARGVIGPLTIAPGGMLVLPRNSSLQMLASPPLSARAEAGCLLSATRPARYKPPAAGAWLDPANWRLDADTEAEAESPVPHSERVPCQQDRAVFPEDMTYKVSVRDADVTVAGVSINGNSLDEVGLRAVFRSQVGSRMFNVTKRVRVTGARRGGGDCGTGRLVDTICSYVQCPDTKCSSPLRPPGHCCYNYCGAVISVTGHRLDPATLRHIAVQHSGGHTRVYVRRLAGEAGTVQVMLVPGRGGNLTSSHEAAARIHNFLLVELGAGARLVSEYSGASPPPGPLARAAAGLGWAVLVAGLLWCGLYLHSRHRGGEVAGLAQLRARLGPGWRQEDLLALRTRVRAQFSGFATFKNTEDGEVEIVGVGKDDNCSMAAAEGMILSAQDLHHASTSGICFSNPMFNVDPPANVYTEEPSLDITFGVENPGYELRTVTATAETEAEADYYEIINIAEDETEQTQERTKEAEEEEGSTPSQSLTNINTDVLNVGVNFANEVESSLCKEASEEPVNGNVETTSENNEQRVDDKENLVISGDPLTLLATPNIEVENTFSDSNDFATELSADQDNEDTVFGRPETVGETVEENTDQGVMSEETESSGSDPLFPMNQVFSTATVPPENKTVDQFDPLSATTITFIEDSDDDEDNLMG